jgi:Heterokaryon incompatibility protein (HET)
MAAEELYTYTPLSHYRRSIRLLLLEPAPSIDSQLKCSISEVEFGDATPKYHALSYVCGISNSSTDDSIFVKDPSNSYRSLYITRNCGAALRFLRLHHETRTMWVDAICIDQTSDKEKSEQVSFMDSIYFHSARVLVWLDTQGLRARKTRQVMNFFNRQGRLFAKGLIRLDPMEHHNEKPSPTIFISEKYSKMKGKALSGTSLLLMFSHE